MRRLFCQGSRLVSINSSTANITDTSYDYPDSITGSHRYPIASSLVQSTGTRIIQLCDVEDQSQHRTHNTLNNSKQRYDTSDVLMY